MELNTMSEEQSAEQENAAEERSEALGQEEQPAEKAKTDRRQKVKQFFSARKIATLGVFAALSFAVSLLEFPIFPQAPFLELDFSNLFVMLMGFAFGPVEAFIVLVIKEVLYIPIGATGGVGELANILMGFAYIILPATVYYFKKGIKVVIPTLIAAVVLQTAASLVCNRYITFPLFMGSGAKDAFNELFSFIIFFNLIKGAIISVLCIMLYKYLSKALKWLKIK